MQPNSSGSYINHYNVDFLNHFDPELQLINTKPVIKKKIKGIVKSTEKI